MKSFFSVFLLMLSSSQVILGQEILPTRLEIRVINEDQKPVEGCTIVLYDNERDYFDSGSSLIVQRSDSVGRVWIEGLDPVVYYIEARKGGKSNDRRSVVTDRLKEGRINIVTIRID